MSQIVKHSELPQTGYFLPFFYSHFFRQASLDILKIHFNQFKINKETVKSLGPEGSNLHHAASDESAPAQGHSQSCCRAELGHLVCSLQRGSISDTGCSFILEQKSIYTLRPQQPATSHCHHRCCGSVLCRSTTEPLPGGGKGHGHRLKEQPHVPCPRCHAVSAQGTPDFCLSY